MEENKNDSMQSSQGQMQPQSTGTNGFAIASLIMGLFPFLNVLAIIFGFVALSQIKKTGQAGKGLAIAGLVLGFVSLAIWIMVWIFVFVGLFAASSIIESAPDAQRELNNLFNEINSVQGNFNVTTTP